LPWATDDNILTPEKKSKAQPAVDLLTGSPLALSGQGTTGDRALFVLLFILLPIGVVRGAKGAMPPRKFLENMVILCFGGVFLSKIVLFA